MEAPRAQRLKRILLLLAIVLVVLVAVAALLSLFVRRMSPGGDVIAYASLQTLADAQLDYSNAAAPHGFAATLEQLRSGSGAQGRRTIDDELGSGVKRGYAFSLQAGAFVCPRSGPASPCSAGQDGVCRTHAERGAFQAWSAEAHPLVYGETGTRSFYVDDGGIVRGADAQGAAGTASLPEL